MDQLYKEIVAFQRKVNDYIDDHSHHIANSLKQEVQRLEDEAQVKKNAHSLESRVKQVMRLIEHAGDEEVISHSHANELEKRAEYFIEELRKLR